MSHVIHIGSGMGVHVDQMGVHINSIVQWLLSLWNAMGIQVTK